MNKIRKQTVICVIGIGLTFSFPKQMWDHGAGPASVLAKEAENEEASSVLGLEEVKDSVVQVVLEYTDEQGNSYILKSGSGFLINTNMVLTDYGLLSLTEEEKEKAKEYLGTVLKKPVSFDGAEGTQKISCQIGVVMYRDVVIRAELNNCSSKEMSLGILNLSEPMNRSRAVLGDSDRIGTGSPLYVLGYKNAAVMQPEEKQEPLSYRDLKVTEGIMKGIVDQPGGEYLGHSAKIKRGAAGGPLVDQEGNVLGLNLSGRTEEGNYVSLCVNEIRQLLDSCEITYQESNLASVSQEDIAGARKTEEEADTSLLDDYILNYSLLEKSSYTQESYQVLERALEHAREVKADKYTAQEDVDAAVEQLSQARSGLVAAEKRNWPFIIAAGSIVAAVIAGLVLYILKLKGILFQKQEPKPPLTLSQMSASGQHVSDSRRLPGYQGAISLPEHGKSLYGAGTRNDSNETTVLGMESAEEGTVVLRSSGSLPAAYLIRSRNQEKIRIDAAEFLIGKDQSRVNYCIGDNPSVSRCHARIQRQGNRYYLSDLKSTNFTYLNHRALAPGEEVELAQGDVIRFSNEEFTFQDV